jgi:hypothetical protein
MEAKRRSEADQRLLHVLSRPLRVQILDALGEKTASPKQLAKVLDGTVGNEPLRAFIERAVGASEDGAFPEPDDSQPTWTLVTVDGPRWQELRDLLEEVNQRVIGRY